MSLLPHLGPVNEHLQLLKQALPQKFSLSTTQKVTTIHVITSL